MPTYMRTLTYAYYAYTMYHYMLVRLMPECAHSTELATEASARLTISSTSSLNARKLNFSQRDRKVKAKNAA